MTFISSHRRRTLHRGFDVSYVTAVATDDDDDDDGDGDGNLISLHQVIQFIRRSRSPVAVEITFTAH